MDNLVPGTWYAAAAEEPNDKKTGTTLYCCIASKMNTGTAPVADRPHKITPSRRALLSLTWSGWREGPGCRGGVWWRDIRIRRGTCAAFAEPGTSCRFPARSQLGPGPPHAHAPDAPPWDDNQNQRKGTRETQGPQDFKHLRVNAEIQQ